MERRMVKVHIHQCPTCGERSSSCRKDCLMNCGCLGTPYCMHFLCGRCRSFAMQESFVQPWWGGGDSAELSNQV
jgi:hypothetical protein